MWVIHDYNGIKYKGVMEAVRKYSREYDVPYFPLTDYGGSVVFIK
jgi:hypothetical protein